MTPATTLLREMLLRQRQGELLPGLRFFEPRPGFLLWAAEEFKNTPVYDVGAGCGHVAEALSASGLAVQALDLSYRQNSVYPVTIANSVGYDFVPGSAVLLCRPNHGPFVEETVGQALQCQASRVVYVGFRKNLDYDLGRFRGLFKLVLKNAGEENEKVWMISLPQGTGAGRLAPTQK